MATCSVQNCFYWVKGNSIGTQAGIGQGSNHLFHCPALVLQIIQMQTPQSDPGHFPDQLMLTVLEVLCQ
jgi:hypothetical protein